MSESKPIRRTPPFIQVLALIGIAAAVVVLGTFSRKQAATKRLEESQRELETQVAQLESEKRLLMTQVAYATTDAAVVEWAQAQGKQAQPGEVLVVPLAGTPAAPTATPVPVPAAADASNWELWYGLFFDMAR